jgi:hypothetical protein
MYKKRYGNREEVYNGIARQTTGGLTKNDLIKKDVSNKTMYISVKLSKSMKEVDNLKLYRKNKKTKAKKIPLSNSHGKTKKISFLSDKSQVKEYYYPELKDEDLQGLREEYLKEEEDDFGYVKKEELSIQDIDNCNLDEELSSMFVSI